MNNNYNNLYCDYIGATGGYSISDYIDITSNTLATNSSNFTLGTSNILNNNINTLDTKIYNVDYKYNNLIRSETENNLINTYIYNSNVGGEIRFYVKNSGIPDINNASGQPYRVKIGTDGKLYLYYNYNVAIGLLESERWVEPINMLIGHNVALGNINTITGATDIAVSALIIKVKNIEAIVYEANVIRNDAVFYNPNSTYDQLLLAYNKIKASFTYANSIYAGIVGSLGFGITFAIYGFIQGEVNRQFIENNLQYQLNYNSNLTNTEKSNLISQSFNVYSSNLNDMNTNLSNLNILNGFINSNITTQQLIPKLKCNEITLNNKAITKFSLESLDNWIKTTNGWYWDATNGNLGINGTPNINDYLIVGGQTTIQGDLITETKIKINNTNIALPTTSINGGNGDKLILRSGAIGVYPYSLGINTNNMWYSVPSGASHNFYINGGTAITSISSTGLSTIGTINASTNLQENAVNLTSKYLKLDGTNTMSGTLNGTTINATTNLQENSVNLTSKYLQLSGGNLTGNLGIGTTDPKTLLHVNGKTLIHNGAGFAPANGLYGNDGTRIILWPGGVNDVAYSLGIAGGTLWYAVPTGAIHAFYVGTTERLRIATNGDLISSGEIRGLGLIVGGASYQIFIAPPSATTAAAIQTIQQGVGFNQNLSLQALGGNVGIGITNPTSKLYVNGTSYLNGNTTLNGNLTTTGEISTGANSYLYAGGLRIAGWDGNTFYSGNKDIGATFNNGYNFNVISWGGNGTILNIKNSEINLNQRVKYAHSVWNISADNINRTYYANNDISYYCCGANNAIGHMFMNSGYGNAFSIYNSGNIVASGTSTSTKSYVSGEDYSYIVNWNGTSSSGWFVSLNQYWYTGHACLNVSITALNVGSVNRFCWFGRVYVSTNNNGTPPAVNGGVIQIICDYRYPASYSFNNNYIDVVEKWDANGNNTLWITIANPIYAGTMRVKIRG